MLKVGNDNVAIKLIDVEYAFSDYAVTFPTKYGIYFLTIKTLYDEIDYQYTIVFNVGANNVEGSIIYFGPVDPNNNLLCLRRMNKDLLLVFWVLLHHKARRIL